MFAIVKTGGKQYKVQPDDVLKIEKIDGEVGSKIILDDILLINDGKEDKIGADAVKGFGVSAEVLEQKKDNKIIIFKKKRRQNYRRKNGHRQEVTVVKISEIGKDLKPGKATAKKAEPKKAEAKPVIEKKVAAKKPAAKKTTTKTSEKK